MNSVPTFMWTVVNTQTEIEVSAYASASTGGCVCVCMRVRVCAHICVCMCMRLRLWLRVYACLNIYCVHSSMFIIPSPVMLKCFLQRVDLERVPDTLLSSLCRLSLL